MNEDFVPFELAVKLKENGYPQKTAGRYNMIDCFYYEDGKLFFHGGACDVNEAYTAPTISQVLKWMREEKNIICLPHINPIEEKWFFYVFILPQASDFPEYMSSIIYNTYEEATLAGIEYVLDNLL